MTDIIGRVVDGVATVEPDLIEWKECPRCAEKIKRRSFTCKRCGFDYSNQFYEEEQDAFAKREEKMKREKAEAPRG